MICFFLVSWFFVLFIIKSTLICGFIYDCNTFNNIPNILSGLEKKHEGKKAHFVAKEEEIRLNENNEHFK